MPSAEEPTSRAGQLERGERVRRPARGLARARALELAVQLVHAPEQVLDGDPAVLEDDLGGMRGTDADLRLLLALAQPGRALADHERGLAAMAELRVDRGHDDVNVSDPAIGDEDLGAVQDPLIAVELRGRAHALDVGAGLRLRHRVGAQLHLVAEAEAFGDPLSDLLRRAGCGETGGGQRGARDRERDPGAAPVHLLGVDDAEHAIGIGAHSLQVLEAVEALLACGSDDLPRRRLLGVVLGGHRPDHVARELTALRLELELLVVEGEIHAA